MKRAMRVAAFLLTCSLAGAQQYQVLWSFGDSTNDGKLPLASLIFDRAGNLYGTTLYGGANNVGTVFELSPSANGSWTESILYNFCADKKGAQCSDGSSPSAGLVMDSVGNLYGTTKNGGAEYCPSNPSGCGTVFELSPPSVPGGLWTQTVLYHFCSNLVNNQCLDGSFPVSQLVLDKAGDLYGTTTWGGSGHLADSLDDGIVFEISPSAGGWTETVLYNFCSLGQGNYCLDGAYPQAGLTFDKSGNLYGTTSIGGAPKAIGGGTVFKLSPSGSEWNETVLHAFTNAAKGEGLFAPVSFDPHGNLYSTTEGGGSDEVGGVFRLSPNGSEDIFSFDGNNGSFSAAGVLIDSKHAPALYGTTTGNATDGYGNIFRISPPANDTVLYNFCAQPNCTDGAEPLAGLIQDQSGNLYGTTYLGGTNNLGVVFELVR